MALENAPRRVAAKPEGRHVILAHFVSFGCYGFWLPNDERGSWSTFVGAEHLRPFGPATKVMDRRSLAQNRHDIHRRFAAKRALTHPAVELNEAQCNRVAEGFAEVVTRTGAIVYGCAVMHAHVHLVVKSHRYPMEQLVTLFKGGASERLGRNELHPFQHEPLVRGKRPKMWERGEWDVYLNTPAQILQKIDYVKRNPIRAGLPAQHWTFVSEYAV